MRIRLGHVTHIWAQRLLPEVLREIAEIGYRGVELFTSNVSAYYDNPSGFGELLSANGLALSSVYFGGYFVDLARRDEQVEEAGRAARFLKALGASHLIVGEASGVVQGEVDYAGIGQTLNRVGGRCLEFGVLACFHPHMGSVVENREQTRRLFDATDPQRIFFCLDTGHIAKGGADPVEVTRTYLDRLRFVHVKDMRDNQFVEMGRGTIDHDSIFAMLRKIDYDGWILPEIPVSPATEPTPKQNATISYRYLLDKLGDAVKDRQKGGLR